jgi:hypothetical protein
MSFHTFRTIQSLCLFAVLLASQSTVSAQESSQSLYERRLGIFKGTSTGIVLYNFEKSQQSAASAPVGANSAADTKPSAVSASQAPSKAVVSSTLQPPSGRSMREASQLGAEDGGITLPTASTPSRFQGGPVTKP